MHSEYNPSLTESNHFFQIWIELAMRGVRPRYSDNKVMAEQKQNQWNFIARLNDSGAAVSIYQDARIYTSKLQPGVELDYTLEHDRHAWLQVATGEITANGTTLKAGDAVASSRATGLNVTTSQPADVLLFDLT